MEKTKTNIKTKVFLIVFIVYTLSLGADVSLSYVAYLKDPIDFTIMESHDALAPYLRGGGEFWNFRSPIMMQYYLGISGILIVFLLEENNNWPKRRGLLGLSLYSSFYYLIMLAISFNHVLGGLSWFL